MVYPHLIHAEAAVKADLKELPAGAAVHRVNLEIRTSAAVGGGPCAGLQDGRLLIILFTSADERVVVERCWTCVVSEVDETRI